MSRHMTKPPPDFFSEVCAVFGILPMLMVEDGFIIAAAVAGWRRHCFHAAAEQPITKIRYAFLLGRRYALFIIRFHDFAFHWR